MNQQHLAKAIARSLLEIGAISLRPHDPFTWSSGIKSPIYCDNRLTMSYPPVRNQIAEGFSDLIRAAAPDTQVIAGTSTSGIPHAAWVSQKLKLPMIYVRGKAKDHGKQNLIEGVVPTGQNVVVIEDLISTGASALATAQAVREAGGTVLAVCAIFTYEFQKAAANFEEHQLPLHTLCNYRTLCQVALEMGEIKESDLASLEEWRAQTGIL